MKTNHILRRFCETQFIALLCFAPGLHAITTSEWRASQTLEISGSGLTRVELPVETLNAARPALEDLRVIDPDGKEVPYLVERRLSQPGMTLPAREFHSTIANDSTTITLATGPPGPLTSLVLETPATDFIKAVRIEASRDNVTWQVLAEGEPIFRQRGGAEKLHIPIPGGAWSFLRLTVDDRRTQPVPFTGAILHTPGVPAPSVLKADTIKSRDENPGETRLAIDLGAANLPLAGLKIETPEPLFTRAVTVAVPEVTDGGIREKTIARGVIYRIAIGDKYEETLLIPLGMQIPSRELILVIRNEDSPPLAISAVGTARHLTRIVFNVRTPGRYSILTGNSACAAPRYDMSGFGPQLKNVGATELTLPPPLLDNPDFKAPEALTSVALTGAAIDLADWKYRKSVKLSGSGVRQLELDLETLADAADDFRDLRLVCDGRQIPFLVERPSISRAIELSGIKVADPKRPSFSRWKFKLPQAALPVNRFACSSTSPLFERNMRLFEELTDDRGDLYSRELGRATWQQTPEGGRRELVIQISAPPTADTIFLETENGDNSAIDLGDFRCFYPVTRLVFKAGSSQPLWLYYGNREAQAPRYDLSLVAGQVLSAEKSAATLGAQGNIKGGKAPAEDSNEHGGVIFWAALALVVVVLLALVSKLLPKPEGK